MNDIFVSYAREDRPFADRLAQALKEHGWSVWWDRTIPTGQTFDEVIERALADSRCVIVVWSASSITSRWVRTEAHEGLDREILIPVLIEDVEIPLAFRRVQAAVFSEWDGGVDRSVFKTLVSDIAGMLAVAVAGSEVSSGEPSARAMIYWHRHGFGETDARFLAQTLNQNAVRTILEEHKDPNPPDSLYIGRNVTVEIGQLVLRELPYTPSFLFPPDLPEFMGGSQDGRTVGIGFSSTHNSGQDERTAPSTVYESDLRWLQEEGLTTAEFQVRLGKIASGGEGRTI